jgi:hypothetical protein
MTLSHEQNANVLAPNQEFAEAKDAADQVFAEIAFEIAKMICTPESFEIMREQNSVGLNNIRSTLPMEQALESRIDTVFSEIEAEDYDLWINGKDEFRKAADALRSCPHQNIHTAKLLRKYENPLESLKTNFIFMIGQFMDAYEKVGKHTSDPVSFVNSQKTYRQIAKLYSYQEARLDPTDKPQWDEHAQHLRIACPGGMSNLRKLIDQSIEDEARPAGSPDPRPPYAYTRGCAALRKPQGETDDAFNMMWKWCVRAVTDPRLQHLLGAIK